MAEAAKYEREWGGQPGLMIAAAFGTATAFC